MKQLFLASSMSSVIQDVVKHFNKPVKGMKIPFIMTAAEGEEGNKDWLEEDKQALLAVGFEIFDYTLTDKTEEQVRRDFKDIDALFFSGGNTFYLLEKIQLSNTANFIKELVETGLPYIGSSAGTVVAGPDIAVVKSADAPEKAANLRGTKGLSLVNFVIIPHWGSEYFRDVHLNHRLDYSYDMPYPVLLLHDNQYVYVKDNSFTIEEVK